MPIGIRRIEFDAHRVFDPRTIADSLDSMNIRLHEFYYLENNQIIKSEDFGSDFIKLSEVNYSLGIFYSIKK